MDLSKIELKELACYIYEVLKNSGIDAILVGGACVTIYSHNQYQSYDLDFVTYEDIKRIEKVLQKVGFRKTGRCFIHKDCPYMIDFVNPPVAIGNAPIHNFEVLKTSSGSLMLLTPTDCVKDRLSAFFHWNDEQALEQALLVATDQVINLRNIKDWAKSEGFKLKIKTFLDRLK